MSTRPKYLQLSAKQRPGDVHLAGHAEQVVRGVRREKLQAPRHRGGHETRTQSLHQGGAGTCQVPKANTHIRECFSPLDYEYSTGIRLTDYLPKLKLYNTINANLSPVAQPSNALQHLHNKTRCAPFVLPLRNVPSEFHTKTKYFGVRCIPVGWHFTRQQLYPLVNSSCD